MINEWELNTKRRTNDKRMGTKNIIYAEESYKLIGIAMKVHRKLGNKYQEKHYQKLYEEYLKDLSIPYKREVKIKVKTDDGCEIGEFAVDFIVRDKILLEFKYVNFIQYQDVKQVLRYLDATGMKLGIIINFKLNRLQYKRIINPRFDKNKAIHSD